MKRGRAVDKSWPLLSLFGALLLWLGLFGYMLLCVCEGSFFFSSLSLPPPPPLPWSEKQYSSPGVKADRNEHRQEAAWHTHCHAWLTSSHQQQLNIESTGSFWTGSSFLALPWLDVLHCFPVVSMWHIPFCLLFCDIYFCTVLVLASSHGKLIT